MAKQRIGWPALTVLAGFLSLVVTAYGMRAAIGIDIHFNPVLSTLYFVLPILSFPLFLLARAFRRLFLLQPILALAYLAVYSALNWRTCASFGYCGSVAATVLLTFRTHSVLAFFVVAILSIAVLVVGQPASSPNEQK